MSGPSLVRPVNVPVTKNRLRRGGVLAAASALMFAGMHLYGSSEPFLVRDINPGSGSSVPSFVGVSGQTLFFAASDGVSGVELWKTDGTQTGTVLVKDITPGNGSSFPFPLGVVGETLLFRASDGVSGAELWKTDGTEAGTMLVKDINPGRDFSIIDAVGSLGETLLFNASDGVSGAELWKTDGTEVGTVLVKDINPGSLDSFPVALGVVGETLFFKARDGVSERGLWKTDGTEAGTVLVKNFSPVSGSPAPFALGVVGETLLFNASDGISGAELWKTDGTEAGTVLVKDINPGSPGSFPFPLGVVGESLFFNASDGVSGAELWKTDGTEAGTVLVKDIYPGTTSSGPQAIGVIGETLLFGAFDPVSGHELWKSDGTETGTVLVKDINPGIQGSVGLSETLGVVGETLLFNARDGVSGAELWKTDGTEAGTVLVKDINPGNASSESIPVGALGDMLLFSATDAVSGRELWAISGAAPLLGELIASHSQKCLDVTAGSTQDGTPIIQWQCHGGDNQAWSIEPAAEGYSRLVSGHSGQCLDVSGASTEDGAPIIQWPCHWGANQQWRLEAVGEGYRLVARHSGKCLDVTGWSTDDGTGIIQWQCHGGANQTWLVRPRGPAPWTSANVGNVGAAGSTTSDSATYTLSGNGSDIWDSTDAFRFMHQPLTGDGSITARVATLQATNAWAKAGVMIRASLDPSAAHAFMFVSLSEGAAFQRRVDDGGLTTHTGAGAATPPQWVRLMRAGAVISAAISTDGTNWTTVGSDTFTEMPAAAFVGLAITSHENGSLATASFDQLQVQTSQPSGLAITSPAPGSSLRVTPVTFKWTGAGDDFWLDIGSSPGASDFYASGPLGSQTQHTVIRMPLNGGALYVQLRRRRGAVIDVVSVQYIAPIRKWLAVITDFSDRRLEDWTGSGMKSVEDVSAMVGKMADHWAWLSRGRERIQWDTIRVQIPAPLSPDPFQGNWVGFRNAVANLIKQQVATADYDVDVDGEIDAAWIIVSNGNGEIRSAIGGSSLNDGVNMFVDGQSSESVVRGAFGNFNHELAHLLGIPDLYGPYDTIHTLTLMSYPWPVPPPDFTAWELTQLGWLDSQVVTQTARGLWLPSAHEVLAAVKIPTARPSEYFLIEYRRRPDTGYGSAEAVPFNGLAVYHVLEGASMWTDPPIIRLEPADGVIVPGNQPLSEFDFVYPENPYMLRPLVLRSHFDGAPVVFQIENVMWRDGGLAFDVVMPDAVSSAIMPALSQR